VQLLGIGARRTDAASSWRRSIAVVDERIPTVEDGARAPQELSKVSSGKTFGLASVARMVARVPLPIRAKQSAGTLVVAGLLALVAVLGLVALGQSNARGITLRALQQRGAYEQLLATDATQLSILLDVRLDRLYNLNDNLSKSDEPDLAHFDPASYKRGFLSSLDQQIGNEFSQLCADVGAHQGNTCGDQTPRPQTLGLSLRAIAPSLYQPFKGNATQYPSAANIPSLFSAVAGASGLPQTPRHSYFVQADSWAASFAAKLAALSKRTNARANALVVADRRSYARSRDLLIGAGAGSLLLALVLGLLVSESLLDPLRRLQQRLAAIAAGDFSGRVEVPNRDEIGSLANDVNRMSDELKQYDDTIQAQARELAALNHTLEVRVAEQVEELRRQSEELRASRARVVAAADAERRRIERDLHDGTQQYLAGVLVNLSAVRQLAPTNPQKATEILDELQASALEAMEALRNLSHGIYPPLLQDRGLREALANAARRTPIPTTIDAPGIRRYEPEVEATVYFCCVEALQNAGKHAGADARAHVRIWEAKGSLFFEVADDGYGAAHDGMTVGTGIANMRDRLGAIGGNLDIESAPGQGMRVRGAISLGLSPRARRGRAVQPSPVD
jgi:signal transduction histidine kinase